MTRLALTIPAALVLLFVLQHRALAAPPTPGDLAFFENKIRPVRVKHCYECHAADAKDVGGKLLPDRREGHRKGGEPGPLSSLATEVEPH